MPMVVAYVYHFMMAFMLAGIIIVFFTMPYHKYPMPKFPITMSKFGNVTVFSIMLCSFAYVMVFGKTLDWFDDPPSVSLRWSVLSLPLCSSIWRRRGVHLISSWRGVPAQGHQLRHPALLPADGLQFQCHVCQRVHQCEHEDEQLAERHLGQLGDGGLYRGTDIRGHRQSQRMFT